MRTLNLPSRFVLLATLFAFPACAQIGLTVRVGVADRAVVGQPYCADLAVHTTQHLANGQALIHQVSGRICRSAAGAEREEATFPATAPDQPATTLAIILDHEHHVATILNARLMTASVRHLPDNSAVTINLLPQQHASGPAASLKAADIATATTDLGTRKDGQLTLTGKRVTSTIAAGRLGNDQPIVSTTDAWASRDLHILVSEETRDPLNGDRSIELTHITTDEPDPALFTVPDGYATKEMADVSAVPPSVGQLGAATRTPQIQQALASNRPDLKNSVAYALANNNDHLADAEALATQAVAMVERYTANEVATAEADRSFAAMSMLASYWDTLAWVYYREGKQRQAEAFERAAFDLKPNPEFCSHLGRIYEAEGRKQDAIAAYQMALAKKSSPAWLDSFQTSLARLGAPGAPAIPMDVIVHLPAESLAAAPPLAPETDLLLDIALTATNPPAISWLKARPPQQSQETAVTSAIQSALAHSLPDGGPETVLRRAHLFCTSGDQPACSLYFVSVDDLKAPTPPTPGVGPAIPQ